MRSKTNLVRSLLSVLFLSVPWCAVATGKIIYVDGDAVGTYDGSSWAYGYRCLQDALAEVRPGDEIRVARGIYKPDRRTVGYRSGSVSRIEESGDRTATFELINGVRFQGGYAGYGEPYPDVRDIDRYETILSGDLAGNDVDNPEDRLYESSRAENSYNVVTGSGAAALDGFTITGGNADTSSPSRNGGGLYNQYGALQVTNCTFRRNSAQSNGGAIYNYRANPDLVNCTFEENSAEDGGGGMCNDQSNPTLTRCTFSGNTAYYGGGIYNNDSNPVLTSCAFTGNAGYDYGGGAYNVNSDPVLTNCIFTANQGGLYGAGVSCRNGDAILTNCTFTGNLAPNGTALAFSGGSSDVTLINCILAEDNPIWIIDQSRVDISYSNISGGWRGEGNIDKDPLFLDPEGPDGIPGTGDEDFGLAPLSPCVDAGDPGYASGPGETDFAGERRVIGDRIDMGAHEFQSLLYVDDDAPDDPGHGDSDVSDDQEDGSQAHPFDAIQEAIDLAKDGSTVLVRPGVYNKIDFVGKPITVRGTDGAAVIEALPTGGRTGGEDAVTFHTGEGPDSVLKNFIIRNSGMAISLNYGSSPTISNITIVDNDFGIGAYENSNPNISNCIFRNNRDGDLFQCAVRYSCIDGGAPGIGNISVGPLFVDEANGDYHLKSEGWRWNAASESWTWDHVTSRCIDAGDPDSPLGDELVDEPRETGYVYGLNRRINMGAFGGTFQASMAPHDWALPEYETNPPEPNPAQWASDGAPRAVHGGAGASGYNAQMTAAEATDASDWVEYFFECTTDSTRSSGWQRSRTYSVPVGRSGQGQYFRVKARDLYANETAWSEELPAN